MASQSLGTLTIDLQAKTANLQNDLGKAVRITEQQMEKIQKSAAAAGTALGAALASGAAVLAASVIKATEYADALDNMAQRTGVSVEALSRLRVAAQFSDTELSNLQGSIGKLAKAQAEAAAGSAEQKQTFDALKVSYQNADGSLRNSIDVMRDLSDIFQALPDGADKTSLAIRLFGKSGQDIIPFLNQGSEQLKEFDDLSDKLGLTLSAQTTTAAAAFHDQLDLVKLKVEGLSTSLAAQLLPDILDLTKGLNEVGDTESTVKSIADAVRGIGDSAKLAVAGVQALTNGILATYNVAKGASELTGPGFFKNLFTGQLGDKWKETQAAVESANDGIKQANKSARDTLNTFGESAGRSADAIAAAFEKSVPEAAAPTKVDSTDAAARAKAVLDASAKAAAASKAQAQAEAAARKAQAEAEAQAKRVAAATLEMQKSIDTSSEALNKTNIPAVDDYNRSITQLTEQSAKYAKDGIPQAQIDAFVAKMKDLAKATEDAAIAQDQLESHGQTLDLQAQAADADAAAKGVVGLAVANRDYEKSLEALDKKFESLQISPEDYQAQLQALDTIHQKTITDLEKQADQAGEFAKEAAKGVQDAIYDALAGEGLKGGIKGFLDGIGDMLRKAAAQIVAADLAKYLFGDYDKTGKVGGALGGGLSSLFGSGGGTASAFEAANIRNSEASLTGGETSWLDRAAGFFGGLFGGARAGGGSVGAGRGYLVGENGPEFFQPSTNGTIVPNGQLGAAGRALTQTNNYLLPGRIDRRTQAQLSQTAGQSAARALARNS